MYTAVSRQGSSGGQNAGYIGMADPVNTGYYGAQGRRMQLDRNEYQLDPAPDQRRWSYTSGGGGGTHGNEEFMLTTQDANAGLISDGRRGKKKSTTTVTRKKSRKRSWIIIGVVVFILIVLAAVLGGVLGSRAAKSSGSAASSDTASSGTSTADSEDRNTELPTLLSYWGVNDAAETETGANGEVYLAIATDTYMLPAYATGTYTSGYASPTVRSSPNVTDSWPDDPSPPSNASIRSHPRLIAPQYKWDALTSGGLIANDPYLAYWNETILGNASRTLSDPPEEYVIDGGLTGSGVLDVATRIKMKVKNWAYAYRITNNTAYADRIWLELWTAAGNNSEVYFGANGTRWNPDHFLDLGEFTGAYAIAYDWLYDIWTLEQREALMWSMLNLGLSFGLLALTGDSTAYSYYWWTGVSPGYDGDTRINGNWNCVCNGGLTMAALAIIGDDPTGWAAQILNLTIPDAQTNCMFGPSSDGTWDETANYWYQGTSHAGELVSSLITAYGDDRGLVEVNPTGWNFTSLYHIYVQGMTSLFNYGDCGPNKYSVTANSLMFWGSYFDEPRYTLYQRDHYDASEPFSMFWYDPAVSGAWWDGLPLDRHFNNSEDEWATARSSWSDNSGLYWAIKAGDLLNHQTHGDLDIGDFVLDAMGQRWAGELGSGQYLSDGYFSSELQNSERWLYYRKRTDGQNTLYIDYQNQNVNATPVGTYGSSGTAQGPAPFINVSTDDTSFFWTDMSTAYNYTVRRGIRMLNGRRQVLLQDDISGVPSGTDVMWRMHTNATVTITNSTTASLSLAGRQLTATLLNNDDFSGAAWSTMNATRLPQDPPVPETSSEDGDQPNPNVTVLVIEVTSTGSDISFQVLFNPQWPDMSASDYTIPPTVSLTDWSLTSHN